MTKDTLAIISGRGALPRLLADECGRAGRHAVIVGFPGQQFPWLGSKPHIAAEFEKLGALFEAMRAVGCTSVVFAGGIDRPQFDPKRFDEKTLQIAPVLLPSLQGGDAGTLKAIASIFESEGFLIEAAHDLLAGAIASPGSIGSEVPDAADLEDMDRAREIVKALGSVDVGQGAVVAQGLCLGLESLQGTDRMLEFVASTGKEQRPDNSGSKGVLFKAAKPGQDLRMDMPAIGPRTLVLAHEAGLAGVAVQAGEVLLLDRETTVETANRLGLFLYGLAAG